MNFLTNNDSPQTPGTVNMLAPFSPTDVISVSSSTSALPRPHGHAHMGNVSVCCTGGDSLLRRFITPLIPLDQQSIRARLVRCVLTGTCSCNGIASDLTQPKQVLRQKHKSQNYWAGGGSGICCNHSSCFITVWPNQPNFSGRVPWTLQRMRK